MKNLLHSLCFLVATLAFILSACNQETTMTVSPTDTQLPPTNTPLPATETPLPPTFTPTFTPTPGVGSTMISNKDGMSLMYIPSGNFLMGSKNITPLSPTDRLLLGIYDNSEPSSDELPQHTVALSAFWIDQTEVTNKMYALCVQDGACQQPSSRSSYSHKDYFGNPEFNDYPVLFVSWVDANTYCAWAGRRLPTEAEWEKAARGENALTYPWGNDPPNSDLLDYNQVIGDTTKVGQYPAGASPYNVFNMAGNAMEWVADWYDNGYYNISEASDPPGPPSGDKRVVRGGSWNNRGFSARAADRSGLDPKVSLNYVGFRCVQLP